MSIAALQSVSLDWTRLATLQLLGLALAAGLVATVVALGHRRRTTRELPDGVAPYLGLVTAGCWSLGDALLRGSLVGSIGLTDEATATYVLATVTAGAIAGAVGGRLGDRYAADVYDVDRLPSADPQTDRLRDARLVVPVDLPEEVEWAEGYRPVSPAVERSLANATVRLPSALSDRAFTDRIERRIEDDFDVDHAQVSLDEDGNVDAISVGRDTRGLGSEISPRMVAIAVHADPADDAASGDPVELWTEASGDARLAARGRLHTRSGDTVTVVVPREALEELDPSSPYRLVTTAAAPTDRNRLLALVRSAPETVVAVTVASGGELDGEFVSWLPGTVLAVRRGESVLPLPADNETLQPDDVVFVLGRPEVLATHDGIDELDDHAAAAVGSIRSDERSPESPPAATD